MRDYRAWMFIALTAAVAAACGDDDSSPGGGGDSGASGGSVGSGGRNSGGTNTGGKATGGTGTGGAAPGTGGKATGGAAPGTGGKATGGTDTDGGTEGGTDAGTVDVTGLTWVENTTSVLVGALEFDTSGPATVTVTVTEGEDGGGVSHDIATPVAAATSFSIRVLGLHASTHYTATVTAKSETGAETVKTVSFDTKALPADFPPLHPSNIEAGSVQSGWTLLPVFRWGTGVDPNYGYLIAVDAAGLPVWYQPAKRPADIKVLANGNILYNEGDDFAVIMDPAGKEVSRWKGSDLGTDTIHHEITPLPGGNYAALGTELRHVTGYTGGAEYDVVGDLAVEYTAAGTIVHKWSVLDLIDPHRVTIQADFDAPFWNAHYLGKVTKDWSHGNAIILDSSDDSFLVSLRHQDWILKIDRATGKLKWKFGKGGDFAMEGGDANFQYHQHAPELEADGHLMVYDNGNGRPGTSGATQYSRAVEFELDTSGGDAGGYTAKVVWEYKGATPYFSQFVGDANKLANGNVLVTDGGLVADIAKPLPAANNQKSARIVEVTHTATPQVVFQLDIKDLAALDPVSYTVYRSIRIAPLK